MRIKIKILTPIHIGSGEEISPMEYFIDRDKGFFHRLNMETLFRDERFKPYKERFIKEAARSRYIGQIIPDQALLRRHVLYSLPISAEARQQIITNPTNIKAYIKSAGRPYLPGSSLKGSLLSALIWFLIKRNYPELPDNQKKEIEELLTRRDTRRANELLLEKVFSWLAPKTKASPAKYARWLNISDSDLKTCQASLQISLVKVKGAGLGKELPILYESLKEDQFFEASMESQESAFSEEEILKIAHDFYLKVAEKDDKYKEKLSSEPYLIRLGQGSTAFSTSLLLLAEDLRLRYFLQPPRTRKRIENAIPLGFAQISLM